MGHGFRSSPRQEDAIGPWVRGSHSKSRRLFDVARFWAGTVALISALVVLGVIVHWSA